MDKSLKVTSKKCIKCQKIIRGWMSRKNNIYLKLKKKDVKQKFIDEINGYHLINNSSIKECIWENINCNIVNDVCKISDEANGSHLSGKDNRFDKWNISNKTSKTDGKKVSLSSYRLTSVCNNKSNGDKYSIVNEIKKRDNTYDYYSILLRNEDKTPYIKYTWYFIPKDYYIFKINPEKLIPKTRLKGKNKGEIIGWSSVHCSITFSMSSQLWYSFDVEDINKYKIYSVEIDNSKPKINYSQIYNLYLNDTI